MPSDLRRLAVALALVAGLGPGPSALAAEIVERVLAVVEGNPVMLSETRALAALRGIKVPAALEAMIDEHLMWREARRLPEAAVRAEDEARALAGLLQKSPAGLLAAHGEPVLRRIARRQAAILKYVDFRFRPQVRVSDDEVEKALAQGPAPRDAADARAAVRRELEARALDERIEAWVRELREDGEVRYNPPSGGS
jgi:hypothetical protein